eukprot:TRINITY_DN9537_c0_g7_i1.p1 TRINITY_DN9537_c0_g7~~TRINITY_DN9537_c0_g7_i1.p1  ORF type:complete len:276 (+),score=58.34 TRINITY_DN9537_c0_g7_i1:608-1435(+)
MDMIDFLRSRPPEELLKLKTPPKLGAKNSSSSNSREEQIMVYDLEGNPVNSASNIREELAEQAKPNLTVEHPHYQDKFSQTKITSLDLNSAFKVDRKEIHEQEREGGELAGRPSVEFVQREVEAQKHRKARRGTARKRRDLVRKAECGAQTDYFLYFQISSSVITDTLFKMVKKVEQLSQECDFKTFNQIGNSNRQALLINASERLKSIIVDAIMIQRQSLSENGLVPTNSFLCSHFERSIELALATLPSLILSLIHICRCRRYAVCRSRWSPYH